MVHYYNTLQVVNKLIIILATTFISKEQSQINTQVPDYIG